MSEEPPDFYLASREGYDMVKPRRCWRVKRLTTDLRNDLLLVRIDPPLIGQNYGLGSKDIEQVLVATRHQSASLFPVKEWPVFVHVARPLIDNPQNRDNLKDAEFESIAWAELYRSEQEVRTKSM
jgi:hypothetical protein